MKSVRKRLTYANVEESITLIGGSNTFAEGFDLSGKVIGSPGEAVVLEGITFRAQS
jgi:hypothetical protein